jgi:hypothetical protein
MRLLKKSQGPIELLTKLKFLVPYLVDSYKSVDLLQDPS